MSFHHNLLNPASAGRIDIKYAAQLAQPDENAAYKLHYIPVYGTINLVDLLIV